MMNDVVGPVREEKRARGGGAEAGRGCWMTSWQGRGWAEEGPCAGSR